MAEDVGGGVLLPELWADLKSAPQLSGLGRPCTWPARSLGGRYVYRLVGGPKLGEAPRDILTFPSYEGLRALGLSLPRHGTNSSNFKLTPNLAPGPPQGSKPSAPNPGLRRDPKFPQGSKRSVATLGPEVQVHSQGFKDPSSQPGPKSLKNP